MVWRFGLVTMTTYSQRHNYPINHTANLHIIFGTANARLVFLCSVYYFYRELKYGTYGLRRGQEIIVAMRPLRSFEEA